MSTARERHQKSDWPTIKGQVRSYHEVRVLATVRPCPKCGRHEVADVITRGGAGQLAVISTCEHCATRRILTLRMRHAPTSLPEPEAFQLGGPEPSVVITPAQFLETFDRASAAIAWTPEILMPDAWRASRAALVLALTCLNELLKFDDAALARAAASAGDAARVAREAITFERNRLLALLERQGTDAPRVWALERIISPPDLPARGEITSRSLNAHLEWVRRKRAGEGRLDVARVSLARVKMGPQELSGARLEQVVFDGADARYSTFDDAELFEVSAIGTHFHHCSFQGAQLTHCDFLAANIPLGRFDRVVIDGGRFARTWLSRGIWKGARVEGASFRDADFGDSRLDDATFVDCDMRGAIFALHTPTLELGTTYSARFEGCDLRDTRWDLRDLHGAVFIRCRWHGASGAPTHVADVTIEHPDLSPEGNRSDVAGPDAVFALWNAAKP
jgi:uncharacterized protein YjbI with pentapeptide repeats